MRTEMVGADELFIYWLEDDRALPLVARLVPEKSLAGLADEWAVVNWYLYDVACAEQLLYVRDDGIADTPDVNDAATHATGSIKWDGCAQTDVDAHTCTGAQLAELLDAIVEIHRASIKTFSVPSAGEDDGSAAIKIIERLSGKAIVPASHVSPGVPIERLPLSVRLANCLRNARLLTCGDVAPLSDTEILEIPNLGQVCLREIRRIFPKPPSGPDRETPAKVLEPRILQTARRAIRAHGLRESGMTYKEIARTIGSYKNPQEPISTHRARQLVEKAARMERLYRLNIRTPGLSRWLADPQVAAWFADRQTFADVEDAGEELDGPARTD